MEHTYNYYTSYARYAYLVYEWRGARMHTHMYKGTRDPFTAGKAKGVGAVWTAGLGGGVGVYIVSSANFSKFAKFPTHSKSSVLLFSLPKPAEIVASVEYAL